MKSNVLIFIIGAAIATYLTRFPLLILSNKKELPKALLKYMRFIAPSILTALITPIIFFKNGKLDISFENIYIIPAIITSIAAFISKNMLLSVITGIVSVGLISVLVK